MHAVLGGHRHGIRDTYVPSTLAGRGAYNDHIGDHYGPVGVRIDVAAYRTAMPDLGVTLDDLPVVGDKVVRRFTLRGTHRQPFLGVPASGRPVTLRGIAIDRLANGRLVERWIQIDGFPSMGHRAGTMLLTIGCPVAQTRAKATHDAT